MSNAALLGFITELAKPEQKLARLAIMRELSNHLYLRSALGISSGELTEQDAVIILQRFSLIVKTLMDPATNGNHQTIARLPTGPEAYAPKKHREAEAS